MSGGLPHPDETPKQEGIGALQQLAKMVSVRSNAEDTFSTETAVRRKELTGMNPKVVHTS